MRSRSMSSRRMILPDAVRGIASTKIAYGPGRYTVDLLDQGLRERTPRLGLWVDNSEQSVAETVEEILARVWEEGAV